MPRVSVVIPTFNRARVLSEAVDSALAQTFSDLEIVIVDDGSTDDTIGTVERRYASRPQVRLLQKANGGPATARNTGLKSAEGELIAFLDSDDLWLPGKLMLQVDLLDRTPEAGLVFCDRVGEGPDSPTRFETKGFKGDTSLKGILKKGFPFATPSVIVRRSVLDEVGLFDEAFTCAEDWDLWIRILARFPITFVDKPLVIVRERRDSISGTQALRKWESWLRLWNKHQDLLVASGCPRRLVTARQAHAHKKIAQTLHAQGKYADSARHYMSWWRHHPWQARGFLWGMVLSQKRDAAG